ncbi:sulfurtransferase [Desulfosediminicola ganghwensis]|uniref:sulfurtransferase n=1 Tax=Desulfosediminicola ganghwensis TaxID=2569540 RepID=UPI001E305DDD|nr:rhodanese-like domain-containing protein [Desulfosediminicola ganghwensis]
MSKVPMKILFYSTIVALAMIIPLHVSAAMQHIDTKKLLSIQENQDWQIVDCRLNDAFNGWKLDGVQQGGHIPGATDFSANWLKVDGKGKKKGLQDALTAKGISKDKNIILYDANGKDATMVAEFLGANGYNNLHYYNINNWPADQQLTRYANYHLIVPAVVVHDIVEGKIPETFPADKKVKIVEASWGEEKTSYAKGHIPTSFHINTDHIEPPTATDPVMWMLADDDTLTDFALNFGFTKDDVVIVTGEEQMAAYRVALVLRYIGVEDVRVLNGGNQAWTMAGYELEKVSHKPVPVADFGGPIPGDPSVIDTIEEAKAGLQTPEAYTLVDNRTWDEHVGNISGYSYHKRKGRIPGSVFGYAGKSDAYSLDYFRNPDKTMRNAGEILALWQEQGIDPGKRLAFMCGSGWRAAEIFYYADVFGLKDIGVYSDGWIGWSNAGNPFETGEPTK